MPWSTADVDKFNKGLSVLAANVEVGDCWVWTGPKNSAGYGVVYGSKGVYVSTAHRWVYELLVADIPSRMVADHLCRNTLCVNPDHVEPVSYSENRTRGAPKTPSPTCRRGHLLEGGNLFWEKASHVRGGRRRRCVACRKIQREARSRSREDALV